MKVLFTGDVYRPILGQSGNILRNYHYFKHALEANGHECHVLHEPPSNEERFTQEEWQRTFDITDRHTLSLWLQRIVGDYDLIVGFELPFGDIAELDKYNIKYIDILHYPIRFTDFTVYGVKSNFLKLNDTITEFELQGIAGKIKGDSRFLGQSLSIDKNVFLFCGQTPVDRSLMSHTGELYTYEKLEEQIKGAFTYAIDNNLKPVFKFHPADWEKMKSEFFFEATCGYTLYEKIVEYNHLGIYQALSTGKVARVLSISSSVSNEAKYFGVKGETLVDDYPDLVKSSYARMAYDDIVAMLYNIKEN